MWPGAAMSQICFSMTLNILCWNVRGLNGRARRDVVRTLVSQENATVVCLQETKLSAACTRSINEALGPAYDYLALPSDGASGGVLLGWRTDVWSAVPTLVGAHSVTACLTSVSRPSDQDPWWITVVYGPQGDAPKIAFLDEVRALRPLVQGAWLLCGDWNMIYQSADKSNSRLNRASMRRFRSFIDTLQLDELQLLGRLFTWSNEQVAPTLERLDRFFADSAWLQSFANHRLRALSSQCSDHCPLLLQLQCCVWPRRRFRFESFWVKLPGFIDVVAAAWGPSLLHADPCRNLDYKLRNTARALRSWSMRRIGSVKLQLAVARETVLKLDQAMERRQLSMFEADLRRRLKFRCLGLASLCRTIARQRSRILFLAEGDANTRFFHLQACHRSRKNFIQSVWVEGSEIVQDEHMADAFFDFYNGILGTDFVRSNRMHFAALGTPTLDLSSLEMCFSEEEVWAIIRSLPSEKAPGPDGFNGLFYKTAWPVIKGDIMLALNAFWSRDSRSLNLLNDAFMVLLRKKPNPMEVKDYRPISLMHSFGKLLAKILAERLAPFLDQLVLRNQSAFIRGRCLHDNFRAVQLAAKAIVGTNQPCLLMKVDIARAFDSVSWPYLLELLRHLGFGGRWTDWISALLSTASTRILLNGSAGRRICHARGLRQGDPLSPMLFVLAMDTLNRLILWMDDGGLLTALPSNRVPHRTLLYADDLVLFIRPVRDDLLLLKDALLIFGSASGLFTNIEKCVATPMSCSQADLALVLELFPCRVEEFPCRYLGVPLSVRKLRRSDEQFLVDAVAARIPGWKGGLLNQAGRTTLVRSTLSAIPIHLSIVLCLSPWAIGTIDRRRRAFLWAGSESVAAGRCRVAWTIVCSPRDLGGLGVLDLRRAGLAFRVRWLWQHRAVNASLSPIRAERAVRDLFTASTHVELGDGRSILFWDDVWLSGGSLRSRAPHLFQATSRSARRFSVQRALENRAWARHIVGGLTMQVISEYLLVWELTADIQLVADCPDRWTWRWTVDGAYSSASAYAAMFIGRTRPLGASKLWKTCAPPKVKHFFWLAMHGRCWTAARRRRHGLQDHDDCILCGQHPETMDHLLLGCVFARELWHRVLQHLHLDGIVSLQHGDIFEWWLRERKSVPRAARAGFDALFFLLGWSIWKERNARTFGGPSSTPAQLLRLLLAEANDWLQAGFRKLALLCQFL